MSGVTQQIVNDAWVRAHARRDDGLWLSEMREPDEWLQDAHGSTGDERRFD